MMNNSFLSNIDGKNAVLKQQILGLCIKSGFSGEIGHFPLLDNNIIC